MFKVEYEYLGSTKTKTLNDTKDIMDLIFGICSNVKAALEAYDWANQASFGTGFVNQKYKFTIKCFNELYMDFSDMKEMQKVADRISEITGVKNTYVGVAGGSLTWKFEIGTSLLKNNSSKGLLFILKDKDKQEICRVEELDRDVFIKKVVTVIKRFNSSKRSSTKESLRNYIKCVEDSTGVSINYCGTDGNKEIYNISIGNSYMTFDKCSNTYTLYMIHSDSSEITGVYSTDDLKKFMQVVLMNIREAKKKYPYEHEEFLKVLVDEISDKIGIKYKYNGVVLGSLTFSNDNSFICNVGGDKIRFSLTVPKLNRIINIYGDALKHKEFVNDVVKEVKKVKEAETRKSKVYLAPNKEVVSKALWLESYNKVGTIEIYRDSCWWAHIEVQGNRCIRTWVGYEDKRDGKTNGGLLTIYDIENQKYGCDFKPKKAVLDKIFSVHRALIKCR